MQTVANNGNDHYYPVLCLGVFSSVAVIAGVAAGAFVLIIIIIVIVVVVVILLRRRRSRKSRFCTKLFLSHIFSRFMKLDSNSLSQCASSIRQRRWYTQCTSNN